MCESGCILRTPLIKSGVLIPHFLFRCAASSSAVYTGEKHFATGTPKPALSLSVAPPSISARERCALIVVVHVPDAIKITSRRDRGRARRTPRQTLVQRKERHPLCIPSGASICSVCALGAPDVLAPQRAGRLFPRLLHDAHEGRTQPHSFATIARSSARAHDLISGQLTRAPCLSRPHSNCRPPVLDSQQVGMLGHGAKRGIHLT
jgi:hypothetical protein